MGRNLPAMWEAWVRSLDLEKEMATHSSILAWTISWTEEPGGLQSMGLQKVGHDWATSLHYNKCLYSQEVRLEVPLQNKYRKWKSKSIKMHWTNKGQNYLHTMKKREETYLESWYVPSVQFSSFQFSGSVLSDSLWPHESQHTRTPCPSPTPGVHPESHPSSRWCHPAISSSVTQHQSLFQ